MSKTGLEKKNKTITNQRQNRKKKSLSQLGSTKHSRVPYRSTLPHSDSTSLSCPPRSKLPS